MLVVCSCGMSTIGFDSTTTGGALGSRIMLMPVLMAATGASMALTATGLMTMPRSTVALSTGLMAIAGVTRAGAGAGGSCAEAEAFTAAM